ncbi:MAG: TetR family transcriptional regulator [Cyclobacteriaceae bacterium]|nr:TetR family transcriptional regulator [Cyclobacteriaceae bacterium]
MSLRKEKAARLKVHVLDNTLKLIGKRPFEDLYVDDLCARVKVSKVTFFKYFPQKEDLLLYYFRVWCLDRVVELSGKPKEGLQGIYYLSDKLSEECEKHPGLMLSLLGYLADVKRAPKPFPVKAEEKVILYPDIKDIQSLEIQSLDQMLEKFTLEAIFRKEFTKSSSTRDITNLLMTILLGSIVTGHINQISPVKFFFRKNLDLILKGLQ